MPRPIRPRSWKQHEKELAKSQTVSNLLGARTNSASPHTAEWSLSEAEDAAFRQLPSEVRRYLREESIIILPPSETLHNETAHGNPRKPGLYMLLTLVRINAAMLSYYYGEKHPNISKLHDIAAKLEKS